MNELQRIEPGFLTKEKFHRLPSSLVALAAELELFLIRYTYLIDKEMCRNNEIERALHPHIPRAIVATNALEHEAEIAGVQEWLGHANISTTRH